MYNTLHISYCQISRTVVEELECDYFDVLVMKKEAHCRDILDHTFHLHGVQQQLFCTIFFHRQGLLTKGFYYVIL